MAVPNYTYLKLKLPGPHGIITVDASFQRAYECEVECCGHATAIIASGELAALREMVTEEAPDAEKVTGSFKLAEGSKEVIIDPAAPKKKRCASAPRSPPNRKARSSTSSATTETSLRGNPRIYQAFQGRSPSTP